MNAHIKQIVDDAMFIFRGELFNRYFIDNPVAEIEEDNYGNLDGLLPHEDPEGWVHKYFKKRRVYLMSERQCLQLKQQVKRLSRNSNCVRFLTFSTTRRRQGWSIVDQEA